MLPGTAAWSLAAASLAAAAWAWSVRPAGPPPAPADTALEVSRLQSSLRRLGAENEALRRELDRLVSRVRPATASAPDSAGARPPDEVSAVPTDELARRAREDVLRAIGGDDRLWQEALDSVVALVNEGTGVFPALRDIYLEAEDERTRRTLLPIMFYSGGGEESLAFIASEMMTFDDPGFRTKMLGAVARVIKPRLAGVFKGAFLAGLEMSDFRARAAAVYGLRHIDDPDVTDALFHMAGDPSEPVRRLAIEALVARDADRGKLRSLIRHDPSRHLREVGECALLVAGQGADGAR